MKKIISFFIMAIFFFTLKCYPQVSFYQDMFNGGVTGAGYSPNYDAGGTGNFTIYIAPGSTIHQAYLMAGRYGAAAAITVTLNGTSLTFDNTNQVSPTFISSFYGGASGVHAIDVTSILNPAVTNYTLVIPNQAGPNDRYNDFYLYVAYSNNTLPQVRTAIFLNNEDFDVMMNYNINVTNPIGSVPGCDVGISLFAGYMCNPADASAVTINGTGVGNTYGPDMNSGICGGPLGSFYYQNNTLNGLSDDNPDLAMTGPDALSNAQTLVPNNSTSLTMSFVHGNGDNAIWAVVLAYGSCCSPGAGPDDTICLGSSTTLNAFGGTSYVWSPASGLSDPNIANPVASPTSTTTYTVSISTGGCSGTDEVTVIVNPNPSVTVSGQIICQGFSATLLASGADTYLWNNGSTLNPVTVNPGTTTTYTVTGTNTFNCTSTATATVTVMNPAPIEAGPNDTICSGASTQLNASGGLIYTWTPATGLSSTTIPNPVANPATSTTYYVTSSVPTGNLIVNGDFEAGNTGFSSGYIYQFSLGPEGTYYVGTNPTLSNGAFSSCPDHTSGTGNMMIVNGASIPGTNVWCQTVSVIPNTDYDFSTWATSVYPISPAILQFSINGVLLGAPFVLPTTPCLWTQFFDTWNSGINTTANICVVNQNTITGGNDFALDDIIFSPLCTSMDSVTVIVTPQPNISISPSGPYICAGASANLTATGATSFLWSDGSSGSILAVSPVSTTSYSVTGTTLGCTGTSTVTVTVSPAITALINVVNQVSCFGLSDGSASVSATGGIGNYTYTWAPSGGTASTASGLGINTYTVTIADSLGCQTTATVTISEPALLTLGPVNVTNILCNGGTTGILEIIASGGTPGSGYSYAWSPSGSGTVSNNLPAATYVITVTDAHGCTATFSQQITQPPAITSVLTPLDEHCVNSCDGSITNIAAGGTPGYTYSWSNSAVTQDITNLCLGSYSVTITDANNCQHTDNTSIGTATFITANFNSDGVWGLIPYTVNFTYAGSGATTYQWNFGDGSPINNTANPSHTYNDIGVYNVVLIVNSGNPDFCTDTFNIQITVEGQSKLTMPNVFTPNGDGFNDTFKPDAEHLETLEVSIYDRWGKQVGEFNTIDGSWDGKNMHNKKEASDGVYYYILSATGKDKVVYNLQGTVTLIKGGK